MVFRIFVCLKLAFAGLRLPDILRAATRRRQDGDAALRRSTRTGNPPRSLRDRVGIRQEPEHAAGREKDDTRRQGDVVA